MMFVANITSMMPVRRWMCWPGLPICVYCEALGDDIGAIPEGLYPGDYLVPVGEALAREHGEKLKEASEDEWLPLVRAFSVDAMMDMIREDLAALNVKHDVFFSERSLIHGEKKPGWRKP